MNPSALSSEPPPLALLSHWNAAWPKIRHAIRLRLRGLRGHPDYADLVQESYGLAWYSVLSCSRRGRPWTEWPGRIGKHAALHALEGRRLVRIGECGRSHRTDDAALSPAEPIAQDAPLDEWGGVILSILSPPSTQSSADACCTHLDFLRWLETLAVTHRVFVMSLINGLTITQSARAAGISWRRRSNTVRQLQAALSAVLATPL